MGRPNLKKAEIERAALRLFAEKGIDGTSIRVIARAAGVTEGALYRHHASKNDLVRALFWQSYDQLAELLERARLSADDPREQVFAMIEAFYRFYDEDPSAFFLVMLVRHDVLSEARDVKINPILVIRDMIERGIARGAWPAQDTNLAMHMLQGLVMEVPVGHRYGYVPGPLLRHARAVATACLGVLDRGAPAREH